MNAPLGISQIISSVAKNNIYRLNCFISGENNRSCYPSRLFHYALLHDNSFFHLFFNASGRLNQFLLRKGTTDNNLQIFIRHFYSLISRRGRIHVCPVALPINLRYPSSCSRTGLSSNIMDARRRAISFRTSGSLFAVSLCALASAA